LLLPIFSRNIVRSEPVMRPLNIGHNGIIYLSGNLRLAAKVFGMA